jgi:DNA-binding MarR family transcriptional regulator
MKKLDTLTEQFVTLSHLMMHRYHHRKGAAMHSPFRGQGRILSLLKMEPEMSQKKLSFLLGTRPQSIGELLAKLEQNGLIVRKPSEEDRRSMTVQLTEKGKEEAVSEESLHEYEKKADEVFNCLTEEEQNNLKSYLERVISSLKETMEEESGSFMERHMHHQGHCMGRHDHGHHGCHYEGIEDNE